MEVLKHMNKIKKFFSGKGYYIALILCATAIGISGYLYYRNADNKPQTQKDVAVIATEAKQEQPVAGTQPIGGGSNPTTPEATKPSTVTKPMVTAAPVEGEIVVVYAMEALGYNPTTRDWRTHNGIDIAAAAGTPVCAAAAGTVYTVYEDETMGTTVVLRHQDGYVTCYASLDKEVAVAVGESVDVGQKLGVVGTTALLEGAIGEHVHFSVTCNDEPVDPAEFLNQE